MARIFLLLGACNGFLTVALGAFGAHALRDRIATDLYAAFQTGVHYHGLHSLALLCTGLLALHYPSPWIKRGGWLLLLGMLLFSVSLYLLTITGIRMFGIITPFGGIVLLMAWLSLVIAIWNIHE